MAKTKKAAGLCRRSSPRRHLFMVHRAVMLLEWGAVAGYNSATTEQVRVLVEGVPENDEMYDVERKRFEMKNEPRVLVPPDGPATV